MKKFLFALPLAALLLAVGCQKTPVVTQPDETPDQPAVEKQVFLDQVKRDTIFYGIDINASDVFLTLKDLPTESTFEKGVKITPKQFVAAALSPAKDRVAFSVKGEQNSWTGMADILTKQITQLTLLKSGYEPGALLWSPDGKTLVTEDVSLKPTPVRFLTVIGLDGSKVFFTPKPADGTGPKGARFDIFEASWSPDSAVLYFTAQQMPSGPTTKWRVNRDGTGLTKVE